jgi:hypothetical protein
MDACFGLLFVDSEPYYCITRLGQSRPQALVARGARASLWEGSAVHTSTGLVSPKEQCGLCPTKFVLKLTSVPQIFCRHTLNILHRVSSRAPPFPPERMGSRKPGAIRTGTFALVAFTSAHLVRNKSFELSILTHVLLIA